MKKILFASYDLNIGGIETSLVTLLNTLSKNEDNEITLVLEKKQGVFLDQINKNINIIEYIPNSSKNIIVRKFINMLKRIKFVFKYRNKFDFAASYATYSLSSSFITRTASKNNALWVHNDYTDLYEDTIEYKQFFLQRKVHDFRHIIFVSKRALKGFCDIFPQLSDKTECINNIIDYDSIVNKSKEEIDIKKEGKLITFLNIGRHDENQKRLTRIINASKKLKLEGYRFKVLLVGEGQDTEKYKKTVDRYKLEDIIEFTGKKKNPFPYYRISDCVVLTSDYEGYPVVFIESMLFSKPIITTNVSDAEEDISNKYGIVVNKNEEQIYHAMKKFIEEGYKIEEKFDPEKYNQEIIHKLEKII